MVKKVSFGVFLKGRPTKVNGNQSFLENTKKPFILKDYLFDMITQKNCKDIVPKIPKGKNQTQNF